MKKESFEQCMERFFTSGQMTSNDHDSASVDEETDKGEYLQCSPVEMRKCLELVEALKQGGIRFVPIPVLSDSDCLDLINILNTRLSLIEKECNKMDSIQILSDKIKDLEKRLEEHELRLKACEDELLKIDDSVADLVKCTDPVEEFTQKCFNCGYECNELADCPNCEGGVTISKKPAKWRPYRGKKRGF